MKKALAYSPRQLLGTEQGEEWFDQLTEFLKEVDRLLTASVKDEKRIAYGEALTKTLADMALFNYFVRRERDQALAAGYERYPKGSCNSEEQNALARQFASEEVRLRSLLEELEAALRMRASLNQTALANAREQMRHG